MKTISPKLKRKINRKKTRLYTKDSPYNPEFVKKVLEAAKGPFIRVDDVSKFIESL